MYKFTMSMILLKKILTDQILSSIAPRPKVIRPVLEKKGGGLARGR